MRKQIKLLQRFLPIFFLFTPLLAFAQEAKNATDVLTNLSKFLSTLLPFLISLGVIYFVWGVFQYFIYDSEEAKKKGRDKIIFGIIGLAVIISVWGLVYLLAGTFGVKSGSAPDVISGLATTPTSGKCPDLSAAGNPKFSDLLDYATCIIGKSVIPFMFAVAIVMFTWGAIKFFIIQGDEETKRTQGKQFMIWGIIALAVMISIWGLVGILGATFGVKSTFIPQVKQQ